MLHILWIILKTILIIIGILLAIVLAVLLLVLFCPVRYEVSADKKLEKSIFDAHAEATVSWLFRLIQFRLKYDGRKQDTTLRICGFTPGAKKEKKAGKESGKSTEKEEESLEESTIPNQTEENIEDKSDSETNVTPDESQTPEPEAAAEPLNADHSSPSDSGAPVSEQESIVKEKTENSYTDVVSRRYRSFRNRIRAFMKKVSDLWQKFEWSYDFLTDERTGYAIACVLGEIKKIFIHILPKKVSGRLMFGFEDPSITGRVLAVAGMTLPYHRNRVEIEPRFEEKDQLEADVAMQGRLYGIRLLVSGVRVLLNRDVWFVIKTLKRKEV